MNSVSSVVQTRNLPCGWYKDFIPLFTCEQFDPDAWAELFRKSGARFVIPTAQHHDNFAMWDSAVAPFNAGRMGPKRDLIGDPAKTVRIHGKMSREQAAPLEAAR